MSKWTQVTGTIRLDNFRSDDGELGELIKFAKKGAPIGSEGGLNFKAIRTEADDVTPNLTILIDGSLGDFPAEDWGKFDKWWEKFSTPKWAEEMYTRYGCMPRQGVLQLIDNYREEKVLTSNPNGEDGDE